MLYSDGCLRVLPDTGAVKNVCGKIWALRAAQECSTRGVPCKWIQTDTIPQGGVGQGSSSWRLLIPMSIGDHRFVYEASVLDSPVGDMVPAPLGLEDMKQMNAFIDTVASKFIIPGPGGLKLAYSPGTECVQMPGDPQHWVLTVNKNLNKGRVKGQDVRRHVAVRKKTLYSKRPSFCNSYMINCPSGGCSCLLYTSPSPRDVEESGMTG